jgi:uncharacterized protein (PEP-CTERM system associated)
LNSIRYGRVAWVGPLAAFACVAGVHAQTAFAPAGVAGSAVQDSGLRGQIEAAFAAASTVPPPSTTPNWLVTPAISVQQEWTDNALQSAGSANASTSGSAAKQASFVTVVIPSLGIVGSSSRLTANLQYSPSLTYYSSVQGENQIGQNLNATALVTFIPDELFLDLRGFAAVQSLNGASGPPGSQSLSRQNEVQSYSFSASPYLDHRFGGWGTAQVGAEFSETSQGALSGTLPGDQGSQTDSTRQVFGSFASGENFGRLLSNVNVSASESSGTGALQGAYRDVASYQAGYAITHEITALASAGWEDFAYGAPDNLHVSDATWSVGAKLTPNADSSVTVLYGHQGGVTAASLDASYALSARTRFYASYSDSVSTDTEQLQTALANAKLDPLGNPVNSETGAPLLLTDNFFGVSGAVYRVKVASLTASWLYEREAVQLTVNYQQQIPVGAVSAGTAGAVSSDGTYGSVAWQHDLAPNMSSSLFAQYGKLSQSGSNGSPDTTLLVASASLSYQFSESLSGSLVYSYTSDSGAAGTANTSSNLIVLGLRKSF